MKILEEGWPQGDGKPLLSSCLAWATGFCGSDNCLDGPWRGRPGPQLPIPAKVFWREPTLGPGGGGGGGKARPSQKPTVIRSMPGLEVPELESETCQNLQKAGLQ